MSSNSRELNLNDKIEERAKSGDGASTIAYALLQLTAAQNRAATALFRLGNGNSSTDYDAIEGLSMRMKLIADAIQGLADSGWRPAD